nr:hypothetical protein [Nitrosomonas nitrosa]
MSKIGLKWKVSLAVASFSVAFLGHGNLAEMVEHGTFTNSAEALIGAPLTPGSVAGVARRTTRRTVRRSAIYASTLPRGCATVYFNGVMTWQCGATYYQAYGTRYVVVYVH